MLFSDLMYLDFGNGTPVAKVGEKTVRIGKYHGLYEFVFEIWGEASRRKIVRYIGKHYKLSMAEDPQLFGGANAFWYTKTDTQAGPEIRCTFGIAERG